jgi:hypothetical protein
MIQMSTTTLARDKNLQRKQEVGSSMAEKDSSTNMPTVEPKEPVQPHYTAHSGLKRTEQRYVKGAPPSVKRLKRNGFDPIDELVKKYRKLEDELDYYEKWRDGRIVPLTASGNIRGYTENMAMIHLNIYEKMTKVAEALLRYAYGRVPEHLNLDAATRTKPLIINLSADQQSYEVLVAKQTEEFDDDD